VGSPATGGFVVVGFVPAGFAPEDAALVAGVAGFGGKLASAFG
jgi:hypothetical protein